MNCSKTELLELARAYSDEPGTCLFFSGGTLDSAQKSYLSVAPEETISISDGSWSALSSALNPKYRWSGYLSYEMGASSDPEKTFSYQSSGIPDACFMRHAALLEVDHVSGKGTLHGALPPVKAKLFRASSLTPQKMGEKKQDYISQVEACKELIRAGDIYQVNLSQSFHFKGTSDPFMLFAQMAAFNPAPFMAYLRFKDYAIICTSPERLLSKRGGFLETRPIKGTAPRGRTPEEDLILKEALLSSLKERAELLMITDLMRNDLGKVSRFGSVKVEKLWHLESYDNVHHMLSIIRSEAQNGVKPLDILRSCFPGGSITGCPKLSSMEVIQRMEGRPRGIYTGSIGYFTENGDFDFNIAIRTMLWRPDGVEFRLGGAIVADSNPENEYQETLYKGASLFRVLGL